MCFSKISFSSEVVVHDEGAPLSPFLPQCGDIVLARWTEDGCFYRARLLEFRDPVYCLLHFFNYGLGLSRYDELYEGLVYLPPGCLIDQFLQQEVARILKKRKKQAKASRQANAIP